MPLRLIQTTCTAFPRKKNALVLYMGRKDTRSKEEKNVGDPGYTFAPGTNLSMRPLVLSSCVCYACPAAQDCR